MIVMQNTIKSPLEEVQKVVSERAETGEARDSSEEKRVQSLWQLREIVSPEILMQEQRNREMRRVNQDASKGQWTKVMDFLFKNAFSVDRSEVFYSSFVKAHEFNNFIDYENLGEICTALSEEQPVPWAIVAPSIDIDTLVIRYGVTLDQTIEVLPVKRNGVWYFLCENTVFYSIKEILLEKNFRIEDSVNNLLLRKKKYDTFSDEIQGKGKTPFKLWKNHDLYVGVSDPAKLAAQLKNTVVKACNDVAAVYKDAATGHYFLMECSRSFEIKHTPIKILTIKDPYFVFGQIVGLNFISLLPKGLTSVRQAQVFAAQARSDAQRFSEAGCTYFSGFRSFKEIDNAVARLCTTKEAIEILNSKRLIVVFRDTSRRLCVYTYTNYSKGLLHYIEQKGKEIEFYNDADKKDWERRWNSFTAFCHDPDSKGICFSDLKKLVKKQGRDSFSEAEFNFFDRVFFSDESSYEVIKRKLLEVKEKIPSDCLAVTVFSCEGAYYLSALRTNETEPKNRMLARKEDGRIAFLVKEGKEKEVFDSFEHFCIERNALTVEEIHALATPESSEPAFTVEIPEFVSSPELESSQESALDIPESGSSLEISSTPSEQEPTSSESEELESLPDFIERGEWLDDLSGRLHNTDNRVKRMFSRLIHSDASSPLSNNEFRLWVKGLAIARTLKERARLVVASEKLKKFSVIHLLWLYELAWDRAVIGNGTKRQAQAKKVIADVLREELLVGDNKQKLIRYFSQNKELYKQSYGDLLKVFICDIKTSFWPEG